MGSPWMARTGSTSYWQHWLTLNLLLHTKHYYSCRLALLLFHDHLYCCTPWIPCLYRRAESIDAECHSRMSYGGLHAPHTDWCNNMPCSFSSGYRHLHMCTTYIYYTVIFCHILWSQPVSSVLIRSIMNKMTEVDSYYSDEPLK